MGGTRDFIARSVIGFLAGGLIVHAHAESDADRIKRGEYLTTAGGCYACHSKPGGQPFAGGRSIATPYGHIASPNITPDKEYGIGNWSDDDFYKAMHEGIEKDGDYLYPVFPYDHYTKVTRDDALAIKAYLFSLPPVHQANEKNDLEFPYNIRQSLAVWRALFFKPGEFQPDPGKSGEVNRGAYLVEALGHCGACHTERNFLSASKPSRALGGATVDGWYAPNITSDKDGIGSWSDGELFQYLKTGATPKHGVAAGPMAEVVSESLSKLSDQDIRSIVAYLKSSPAKPSGEGLASTFPVTSEGQGLYLSNCAGCHQMNGEGLQGKIPALAQNGSVTAAGPDNIIKVVLGGLYANANYGPMPAFAAALSDEQIAAIANYVRASWGNGASPNADPITVARARQTMDIALVSGESGGACPPLADPGSREAAEKMPGSIKGKLQSPELLVVLQSVPSMIQEAKAAAPNASASELTNALTDLYCPAVAARKEASKVSKREQLDRFAQVVYTQLTGGNALGKQAQAQRAQQPAQ